MISVKAMLQEYCNSVSSPSENRFICNIDNVYVAALIHRLNMLDHCVTQVDRTTEGLDSGKCVIKVEKATDDPGYDDYGDDYYYK
jgi:hypothetical protein